MLLAAVPPPPFTAVVVRVSDGDTLVVTPENPENTEEVTINVRLACVDAPERGQSPRGKDSGDSLKRRVPIGTVVQVTPTAPNDRYNRMVAFVWYGKTNLNLEQVAAGQAWFYAQYQSTCPDYAPSLKAAEETAKLNQLGLWQDINPCAPWDWRSNKCLFDCRPVEILAP